MIRNTIDGVMIKCIFFCKPILSEKEATIQEAGGNMESRASHKIIII